MSLVLLAKVLIYKIQSHGVFCLLGFLPYCQKAVYSDRGNQNACLSSLCMRRKNAKLVFIL